MDNLNPDATGDETPKLHVDSDWKAEAERERAKLAEAEARERMQKEAAGDGERGELPEPNFRGLVSMLASQALMGLGTMSDPDSKGVIVDLEGSRFAIDLLGVLDEKTKGNLTEEESTELTQALGALRARYIEIGRLVSEQMAGGGGGPAAPGGPGGPGGPAGGGGGSMGGMSGGGIIDPTA